MQPITRKQVRGMEIQRKIANESKKRLLKTEMDRNPPPPIDSKQGRHEERGKESRKGGKKEAESENQTGLMKK